MKRLTALFLALLMVFSAVPAVSGLFVFADEPVVETVYVNGTYTGTDSDGSQDKPFLNLNTAYYYLANLGVSPDEAVILVTGDTPLAETIKSRAENRYFRSSVTTVSGGKNLTILFQPAALDFPVTIRGAGGKFTQSFEKVGDIADPSTSNPDALTALVINFYVRSDLTFDNIEIDAYADTTTVTATNAVSLVFEDDVKVNDVTADNFNITMQKLGNTLKLLGGKFSVVTMDTASGASAGSSTEIVVGQGVTVNTLYGCGKTETAVFDIKGNISTMYMGGVKYGAQGTRTLNLNGGNIGNLYLGAAIADATSSADYIINLHAGEINLFYATGAEDAACTGTKTLNAYDGYEYSIAPEVMPGFDAYNEYRTNPPAGILPSTSIYVGEGGDDALTGKTPETKMETLDAAINRAIGLYKRQVAEKVVIRIVGRVVISTSQPKFVTPQYDFPLTIQGGDIDITYTGTQFSLVFQGPLTMRNVNLNAPNAGSCFLYNQNANAAGDPINPEAAYPFTGDNFKFTAKSHSWLVGRNSAEMNFVNGSKVSILAGGKTVFVDNSTIVTYILGNYKGEVPGFEVNIVIRNSTIPLVFGTYCTTTDTVNMRFEKGTVITNYINASYCDGSAGTNGYVENFNVTFAGGRSQGAQINGKGQNYYRFDKTETGETGTSRLIVDGNLGVKYAPKESEIFDFDSYEIINYNENVKETVYVDPTYAGGDSDGSKTKPLTNLKDAFKNFADLGSGGSIILLSDTEVPADADFASFDGNVTITSNKKATLFLGSAASNVWKLSGPMIFKNITLAVNAPAPAEATIYGMGHELTFGAGVTVSEFDLNVYGGEENGESVRNVKLTLNSGNFKKVVGGNGDGVVTGNVEITVEGATIETLIGGSENGTVESDVYIWIEKGTVGSLYAANYESGTVGSTGVLLRNKKCEITDLATTMLSDGVTSAIAPNGKTILRKLGASKLPADEFVVGFDDISNTTAVSFYVNGQTRVKIENANGTKSKPYNNIIDAFIAAQKAEAGAGKLLESIQIIIRGETELSEIDTAKVSKEAAAYIKIAYSIDETGETIKALSTSVSTPEIVTPVVIRGSSDGKLIVSRISGNYKIEGRSYPVTQDQRTFAPNASITWRNISITNMCNRFHMYPGPNVTSYFTDTFTLTGNSVYAKHAGGNGSKWNMFGGTVNYLWANDYGTGDVVIGGNARINQFLVSYNRATKVNFEVLGGYIGILCGGPQSGTVNGDITITMVGGTAGKLYAGGYGGQVNGSVRVNLGGGTITGVLDGDNMSGPRKVSGRRTLRYTVECAVKARTATNFDSMKMVDRIVATGDDGAILIWSGILLFAIASVAALLVLRRRNRYSEN